MAELPGARVAVVMRTKDRPVLLDRALRSVLGQSMEDWVLSVVNDGGDPKALAKTIDPHRDAFGARLVVTSLTASNGMEAASNVGLKAVDSTYCAIHDDDDSWSSSFLQATTSALEDPQAPLTAKGAVTHCSRVLESIEGNQVKEEQRLSWPLNDVDLTLWNMCFANCFPPIAFLYKREALDLTGAYDESMRVLGDWEFNLRFLRRFDILKVPQVLAHYHARTGAPGSDYFSTVTHQTDLHRLYQTLLLNRLVREDLDSGRFGIGSLANIAHGSTHLPPDLEQTIVATHQIADRFNHIKARAAATGRRIPGLKGLVSKISGNPK